MFRGLGGKVAGFRVHGLGFWVFGFEIWDLNVVFWDVSLGFRVVHGLKFRDSGIELGYRV
jgi:hypothetical protein